MKAWKISLMVEFIYIIYKFHILNWIIEINYIFHNIQMYWNAPVELKLILTCRIQMNEYYPSTC